MVGDCTSYLNIGAQHSQSDCLRQISPEDEEASRARCLRSPPDFSMEFSRPRTPLCSKQIRMSMDDMQEKCKALKAQINAVTETLKETRIKWRHSRLQNTSLQDRLKAAIEGALTLPHSNSTSSDSYDASVASHPPTSAAKGHQMGVDNMKSHYTQLVPIPAARPQLAARFCHSAGPDTENAPGAWPQEDLRPVSSFTRCEPLSLAAICDFIASGEAPKEALKHTSLAHAINAYQHSVSTRTGVPVADICWFNQWEIAGLEPTLSCSVNCSTPECNLSVAAGFLLEQLESMLLVVEHEMLLESSDPSYKPPKHPTFAAASAPVPLPTPPDPRLLNRFHISCGVNQKCPLGLGLGRILKALLATHRARLPLCRFQAVCMQAMRIMHAMIEAFSEHKAGDTVSNNLHDVAESEAVGPESITPMQTAQVLSLVVDCINSLACDVWCVGLYYCCYSIGYTCMIAFLGKARTTVLISLFNFQFPEAYQYDIIPVHRLQHLLPGCRA